MENNFYKKIYNITLCNFWHNESNKIEFAFFLFFYDFPHILQDPAKHMYYLRSKFRSGPWKFLALHKYAPDSRKTP
jgi:hypothetical protein